MDDDAPAGPAKAKRKLPRAFHPPLVAAFPVLFLWAHNLNAGATWNDVSNWLLGVVGLALLLWGLLGLALRDSRRSALAVSWVAVLFFSYGYVAHGVQNWHLAGVRIGAQRFLAPVWFLLAVAGVILCVRGGKWVAGWTSGANVVAAGLVLLNVFSIVLFQIQAPSYGNELQGAPTLPASLTANPPTERPDIYYIILEEYGGANTLTDTFHFDNTPFLNFLSSKGFYVAPDSVTNYPRTEMSVASSLNMRYLSFLTKRYGTNTGNNEPLIDMMEHPDAGILLKQLGYDFIQLGSWWKATRFSPTADHNVTASSLSEFSRLMFGTTALTRVTDNDFLKDTWRITRFQFNELTRLDRFPGPRFVFAHIICPHDPLVFARDGSFVSAEEAEKHTRAENYLNQLIYVNTRVEQIVTDLLNRPVDQQPVIVIQSDEGPYPGAPTVWEPDPDDEIAQQKFDILNAYYFPQKSTDDLQPTITPVNTFRVILNTYFGANLAVLPDRAYTFASYHRHMFEFQDVTAQVQALSRTSPDPSPSASPP